MPYTDQTTYEDQEAVTLTANKTQLEGLLGVPEDASGIVVFAHGSGSSRHSPRNNYVAHELRRGGMGTLLFDLLTEQEDVADRLIRRHRFDIGLLARRLTGATNWVAGQPQLQGLPIGYFGASTGAAAALQAAADRPARTAAVVSRGGRPDLADDALAHVTAPVRLIVGGNDQVVVAMNEEAAAKMTGARVDMQIVPGAGHLFEEPGKLEQVATLAREWFEQRFAEAGAEEG